MPGISDYQLAEAGIGPSKVRHFGSLFGKTYYVDSTHRYKGTTKSHGTFNAPFSTIAAALASIAVNGFGRGDVILVSPLHTETITAAGGLNFDATVTRTVAGTTFTPFNNVTVRGIGHGQQRPKITFTTVVGASIIAATAGVRFENIHFDMNDIDALTGPLTVTGADCYIQHCWFNVGDNTNQPTCAIDVSAAAARFHLLDSDFVGTSTAGSSHSVKIAAANVPTILRNRFNASYGTAVGAIEFTGAASRCLIAHNVISNSTAASTIALKGFANITGVVAHNVFCMTNAGAGAGACIDTPGAWHLIENYASMGDAGEYGIIVGSGAST